jgi:iron complex transport system substrate-binding protein
MSAHLMKSVFAILIIFYALNAKVESAQVADDLGRTLKLSTPAQRIISLAPHITENLFAAGLGDLLVGAVTYSDYPEEAKSIPRIGSYNKLNIELILALEPDLIIAWKEGNQKHQVEKLIGLGLTVYINAPQKLGDIASDLRDFGLLSGKEIIANKAATKFTAELDALRNNFSGKEPISVFYETWHRPLVTVNDEQFIGRILKLCSGKNIFAELEALTPQVSEEAVLAANPDVIIASGHGEARPEWLDRWRNWPLLNATKNDRLFFVPPQLIQRHTPRLLEGTQLVCEYLQNIRTGE